MGVAPQAGIGSILLVVLLGLAFGSSIVIGVLNLLIYLFS
jgi:hypothetical protein